MNSTRFHPVIFLPADYEVYDFSKQYDPNRKLASPFGVGRYNEKRPNMYQTALFLEGQRDVHMGIDMAAPAGTPVHAFAEGEIFLFGFNGAPGDYGNTVITKHLVGGETLYALYGHLSSISLWGKARGQKLKQGECFAWLGRKEENGGWNPHLHFQLSREEPTTHDMPGVVSESMRAEALQKYPDPQLVLGKLY